MGLIDSLKIITGNKTIEEPVPTKPSSKVMVVEDDVMLLTALEEKFKHEGFTVLTSPNGKEALDKIIDFNPNILILDLMMPIMDGKIMLQKLREIPQFKQLPVIILTNAGEVENITETVRYFNAMEFIVKSNISLDELVEKVKTYTF